MNSILSEKLRYVRQAAGVAAFLSLAILSGSGCAIQSAAYVPTSGAQDVSGVMSAQYAIPPTGAKGNLYVTSFGGRTLGTGEFLHIRMALANDSDSEQSWVLDAREQQASIDGQTWLSATYAEGSSGAGTPVTLAAGNKGFLDLYFPLPARFDPPNVQVAWKLRRGSEEMADRSVFQRTEGRSGPVYTYAPYGYGSRAYLGIGVGPGWWWGPRPYWAFGWDYWPYDRYGFGWGVGYGWGGYWGYPYAGYRSYYPRYYGGGYHGGGGYSGGGSNWRTGGGASLGGGWHGGGGGGGGGGRSVHSGRPR